MKIYAEIYNRGSARYWRRGIFILREVYGRYYWYPFCELDMSESTPVDFDVSCVLEKSDCENCEIENLETKWIGTPRGHGYKLEPGDLASREVE